MASMSDIPDRDQIAADELRMGELLRAVEAPAPSRLQARIASRNADRRPWWQSAPGFALGLAGAASAACVALVILLTSGSAATAPTVISASRLALARPTQPARHGLVASGTNIAFPDWSRRGWPAAGMRDDELGGRAVTTVFYRSYEKKGTAGYAIVAGGPLRWGANGIPTTAGGQRYTVISSGGARIVTWVQDGHTCIIASRNVPPRALVALASAEQHSATA
jgi:hypothetical protein